MLYLSNADVAAVLDVPTTIQALREGYADLARGDAAYTPRLDVFAPTGRPDDYYVWGSMAGVCRATGVLAVRMKSDVISWPDGQTQEKYCVEPGTYCGLIFLFSVVNGEPLAMINDGYVQHMRVGGCAGLGTEVLARPDASVLGMIGSGGMARTYLEAIAAVRSLRRVKVYSPTRAHREQYAQEMEARLKLPIEPVDSAEEAVRGSDIVATATDAMAPTFRAEWVEPGAHVVCVTRREVGTALVDRADVVRQLGRLSVPVEHRAPDMEYPQSGVASYVTGQPEERARLPWSHQVETREYPHLVDIQTGRVSGRTDPRQVTLFINTGSQGVQFAAVAGRAYQLARERGLGRTLPLEWFLQDVRD